VNAAVEARKTLPLTGVCTALALPRSSLYRSLSPPNASLHKSAVKKPMHPRALSMEERQAVLAILHSERFVDAAPATVWATLLDEGTCVASIRTMYRILGENGEVRERRAQATHPTRKPPQLLAEAPRDVWTWDITHLRTTVKGRTLKLYVCIDLYSRYVVGWYLSATESSAEASHLFGTLAKRERIGRDRLVLHADNGGPMRGQPLADLLETLAIGRSHSRPRTSNDNAHSESQFKTMKYRPDYPRQFDSEEGARPYCQNFFDWYNYDHRHAGIALFTPDDVYTGKVDEKLAKRAETLALAYERTPNRFVKGLPIPKKPPTQVAINPTPKPPPPGTPGEATQRQEVAK